jgi:hypothetical protein
MPIRSLTWVHYGQGRLPEALDAIEEAWKHAQLTEHVSIQVGISLDFVKILFTTNRDAEAWEYIEIITNEGLVYWESAPRRRTCIGIHGLWVHSQR